MQWIIQIILFVIRICNSGNLNPNFLTKKLIKSLLLAAKEGKLLGFMK